MGTDTYLTAYAVRAVDIEVSQLQRGAWYAFAHVRD